MRFFLNGNIKKFSVLIFKINFYFYDTVIKMPEAFDQDGNIVGF